MEINKITIKVQASMNYQVASMEAEIQNYNESELEGFKQYLVEQCAQTVKTLSNAVGPTHTSQPVQQKPVVQTQVQRPVNNGYQAPRVQAPRVPQGYQPQPAQGPQVRFASEKQIQYLRSFGWNGNAQGLTWSDADTLLKQYKGEI